MEEAPRYKLPNTAHTSHIAFTAYTTYIAYTTQLRSKSAISYYAHTWSSQRIVVGRTGWNGQIIALTLRC